MDQFVMSQYTGDIDNDFLCNSATQLLESGAEFGSCSDQDYLRRYFGNCTFAFAGSAEVLDGTPKSIDNDVLAYLFWQVWAVVK